MAGSESSSGRIALRHSRLDVACSLGAGEAGTRVDEWRRLHESAGLGVERIEGGVRLWLRPGAREAAADLARRESECCGFLDFYLVPEGGRDRLDITSTVPEAGPAIESLVGGECS